MGENTIYLGYYKGSTDLEAIGLWENGCWDVFLAENEHPNLQHYLFRAASIDEAYDHFYQWIEQHLGMTPV